jgi:DinB superfamily
MTSDLRPQTVLENFISGGRDFISLAQTVPDAKMNHAPSAGEWSAAFVIHHMADSELHFATRYLFNLVDERPNIQGFNEEFYPERIQYQKRNPQNSLKALQGIRAMIEEILKNATPEDWNRISIRFDGQEVTLLQIVDTAGGHCKAHLEQLKSILAS